MFCRPVRPQHAKFTRDHPGQGLLAESKYASLPWSILWGYLFFGSLPDLPTLLGAVVIVYGGIYALRLEGGAWPRKAALVILSDEDKP